MKPIGNPKYFDKRTPVNPRYNYVKARLDTGCSLSKCMEREAETQRHYRYRNNEPFKRLKVPSLAQLILHVSSLAELNDDVDGDDPLRHEAETPASYPGYSTDAKTRDGTDTQSVMSEAEVAAGETAKAKAKADTQRMFELTTPKPSPMPPLPPESSRREPGYSCNYSTRSTLLGVISGVGELDMNKNKNWNVQTHPPDMNSQARHQPPLNSNIQTPDGNTSRTHLLADKSSSQTPVTAITALLSGVGELDTDRSGPTPVTVKTLRPNDICPYLLLDVRDQEQYDRCHIIGANNYPLANLLTHHINTTEMRTFKNVEGKIIIVYDEDEILAGQAGRLICERGFENVYMLSGGLKSLAQEFPEGMTTGSFPVSCQPSPMLAVGRRRPEEHNY